MCRRGRLGRGGPAAADGLAATDPPAAWTIRVAAAAPRLVGRGAAARFVASRWRPIASDSAEIKNTHSTRLARTAAAEGSLRPARRFVQLSPPDAQTNKPAVVTARDARNRFEARTVARRALGAARRPTAGASRSTSTKAAQRPQRPAPRARTREPQRARRSAAPARAAAEPPRRRPSVVDYGASPRRTGWRRAAAGTRPGEGESRSRAAEEGVRGAAAAAHGPTPAAEPRDGHKRQIAQGPKPARKLPWGFAAPAPTRGSAAAAAWMRPGKRPARS